MCLEIKFKLTLNLKLVKTKNLTTHIFIRGSAVNELPRVRAPEVLTQSYSLFGQS